jgi:hypothetical protein
VVFEETSTQIRFMDVWIDTIEQGLGMQVVVRTGFRPIDWRYRFLYYVTGSARSAADPRAVVEIGADTIEMTAQMVSEADLPPLWQALSTARPMLAEIQTSTDRTIPLVVLQPRTA